MKIFFVIFFFCFLERRLSKGTQYEVPSNSSIFEKYNSEDYEKISFSLTLSSSASDSEKPTDNTIEQSTPQNFHVQTSTEKQATFRQLKEKFNQQHKENQVDIYENLPVSVSGEDVLCVPEFVSVLVSHPPDVLNKVIPMIRKSRPLHFIKNAKNDRQQNATTSSHPDTLNADSIQTCKKIAKPTSDVKISLTELNHENVKELEKDIPNAQDQEKQMSLLRTKERNRESKDKDDNFTVMTLEMQGNTLKAEPLIIYPSALEIAQNGRYIDEADLFCENIYTNHAPCESAKENVKKNVLPHNIVDSSNSDSITSYSLSDGEVKCHCSVSSGEIHKCSKRDGSLFSKQNPIVTSKPKHIVKKLNYFNNWVTYYVSNDEVNDSSWYSSK